MPQPDDAGAQTADRLDWQAAMATGDGLALYEKALDGNGHLPEDNDCRIVCERHEDWALAIGGAVELVSAKHRDSSYGAYTTVNQIAGDGGIAHLFNRWHALAEKPTCRLVTTPGLADTARALAAAMQSLRQLRLAGLPLTIGEEYRKSITDLCRCIRQHSKPEGLPVAWMDNAIPNTPTEAEQAQSTRFLSMLDIEHTSLPRDFGPYSTWTASSGTHPSQYQAVQINGGTPLSGPPSKTDRCILSTMPPGTPVAAYTVCRTASSHRTPITGGRTSEETPRRRSPIRSATSAGGYRFVRAIRSTHDANASSARGAVTSANRRGGVHPPLESDLHY